MTLRPEDFGAFGDGVADDEPALTACVEAATTTGQAVELTGGATYRLSRYVKVFDAHGLYVRGYGATIVHPSDDPAVTADRDALLVAHARSGLFVLRSSAVTIEGVSFQGGTSTAYKDHSGAGVYARQSHDVTLRTCWYLGGSALVNADEDDSLAGSLQVEGCFSHNARHVCTLPSWSTFRGNTFTQDEAGFDYGDGSTHCLYFFAGRKQTRVVGNTFHNVHGVAVKFSGTAKPVVGATVTGNTFDGCGGGVVFGADDTQEHGALTVTGNVFANVGTGAQDFGCVSVLGSRSVTVSANTFWWDRDAEGSVGARAAVSVSRYTTSSQPVESVLVTANTFDCRTGPGYATAPDKVIAACVSAARVGLGADGGGSLVIAGNVFGVGVQGVTLRQNLSPLVAGNTFKGLVLQATFAGDRQPVFRGNVLVPGVRTSTTAAIRLKDATFPVIERNVSNGLSPTSGNGGRGWSVSDNTGSGVAVDFPLLGATGKVTPAGGREEALVGWGASWADGDTVTVGNTTFTYRAASPGPGEFGDMAGLVALVDGLDGYEAADYGAPWGVATGHIRVRRSAPGASPFPVRAVCRDRTAGVVLANGYGTHLTWCYSRGGQAVGSRVVLWSPLAGQQVPQLLAVEPSARALTAANGVMEVGRDADDNGQVAQLDVGPTTGAEQWRWAL